MGRWGTLGVMIVFGALGVWEAWNLSFWLSPLPLSHLISYCPFVPFNFLLSHCPI